MGKYKYKIKEQSTTGGGVSGASFTPGTGEQYATPFAFKKKKKLPNIVKAPSSMDESSNNPGASLGPGPKASKEGVIDNYYVKKFKYKLVPRKIKGSGLEVKQLFEKDNADYDSVEEFHKDRIEVFDKILDRLNKIYPALDAAKDKTVGYYNDRPTTYDIVYPTDMIMSYIEDIEKLLNINNNEK